MTDNATSSTFARTRTFNGVRTALCRASRVLSAGDGLQVPRVNATGVVAKMVDLHAHGDRTDRQFVDITVRSLGCETPVTRLVAPSQPEPTFVVRSALYQFPKHVRAALRWLLSAQRVACSPPTAVVQRTPVLAENDSITVVNLANFRVGDRSFPRIGSAVTLVPLVVQGTKTLSLCTLVAILHNARLVRRSLSRLPFGVAVIAPTPIVHGAPVATPRVVLASVDHADTFDHVESARYRLGHIVSSRSGFGHVPARFRVAGTLHCTAEAA